MKLPNQRVPVVRGTRASVNNMEFNKIRPMDCASCCNSCYTKKGGRELCLETCRMNGCQC